MRYRAQEEGKVTRLAHTQTYRPPVKEEGRITARQNVAFSPAIKEEERLNPTFTARPIYRLLQDARAVVPQHTMRSNRAKEQTKVSAVEYFVSEIFSAKDAWVDVSSAVAVGGCNDVANHGTTDLKTNRNTLVGPSSARTYIGFNLSGFSTGATVTSASLVLRPTTIQNTVLGATPQTITIGNISTGNENWGEGTIVCSNAPGFSSVTNYSQSTAFGTDTAINVTPFSTVIADRMGTTLPMTFVLLVDSTGTSVYWQSKESPAGTTDGSPRLRIRYTVSPT